MIKFFRKIRQRLVAENKFTQYLIYALGEIVLVVVGILIALQINNWNEAQKDHAYEVKMLTEIVKGLETDKLNLLEHKAAYVKLKTTVDYFVSLSGNHVLFHDSLYQRLWVLNTGRYFQFNSGIYGALKSSGIDRISNDSLRNHLINFYDFRLPVFENKMEHNTRNYRPNVETLLSFLGESYVDDNNSLSLGVMSEDLLQKPAFLNLLGHIEWRASNSIHSIEDFIPEMDALIERINTEIEQ